MNLVRLSSSSLSSFRKCLRQYYYRYILGLEKIRDSEPLRMGTAFHKALEAHNCGASEHDAIDGVLVDYQTTPAWSDPTDWQVEAQTLRALISGHIWRYSKDNVEFVSVEQFFQIPLVNPATKSASRKFALAGKIDAIVKLPDGRLAVLEYKTAGEDIAPDSEYWQRLRCDGQISIYVIAARSIGYDISTVIYDVTRKPTIRLRQSETPEQYGQRLMADIGERPDYYFQRREVPRLEDDLAECRYELWQQARQLMEVRKRAEKLGDPSSAWFRNVSRTTCGQCEFSGICLNGLHVRPGGIAPSGYQIISEAKPTLAKTGHESCRRPEEACA